MKLASHFNYLIAKYYIGDVRMKPILDIQMPTVKTQFAEGLNEISFRLKRTKINNVNTLDIEVCNTCNLNCTICPVNQGIMKREKGMMSFSLFKNIIDNNKYLKRIRFTLWGEPLLHKDLFKFIEYAKEHTKAHLLFYTNATILNSTIIDKIIKSKIDMICISVDGGKKSYEKIRGFSYNTLKKNIITLRDELRKKKAKTTIHIQGVGTPEVLKEMDTYLEEWNTLGLDSVEIVSYTPYSERNKRTNEHPCRFLWRGYLAVTWNGDITVCCTDYDCKLNLGNLKDKNYKLNTFINSKKIQSLRKAHLLGKFPIPCNTCTEYKSEKVAKRFNI